MNLPEHSEDRRLLQPRKETARMLGVSIATVIRLEHTGVLSVVKLSAKANGLALHRVAEVEALADSSKT